MKQTIIDRATAKLIERAMPGIHREMRSMLEAASQWESVQEFDEKWIEIPASCDGGDWIPLQPLRVRPGHLGDTIAFDTGGEKAIQVKIADLHRLLVVADEGWR